MTISSTPTLPMPAATQVYSNLRDLYAIRPQGYTFLI